MLSDLMTVVPAGASSALTESKSMLMAVVTASGVLVVFFVLLLLIFVFYAYGGIFQAVTASAEKKKAAKAKKAEESAKAAKAEVTEAAAPVADIAEGEIPGEIIAVIAAAVASLDGGKNLVVKKVRRAPTGGRSAWAAAGVFENTRPF